MDVLVVDVMKMLTTDENPSLYTSGHHSLHDANYLNVTPAKHIVHSAIIDLLMGVRYSAILTQPAHMLKSKNTIRPSAKRKI